MKGFTATILDPLGDVFARAANALESLEGGNGKFDEVVPALEKALRGVADRLPVAFASRALAGWPEFDSVLKGLDQVPSALSKMEEARERYENQRERTAERMKEATDVAAKLRNLAADVSQSKQAEHFLAEAQVHTEAAQWWLRRAVAIGLVLVLLILDGAFWHGLIKSIDGLSGPAVAQNLVGRALLFAAATTFLLVALRQFGANRHNVVVNRHRANALNTYSALVAAGNDAHVRDIILTQAATCIFAPQPTGFTKASGGESEAGAASAVAAVAAAAAKGHG
jgi:hypothetical protein